jgi:putative hydrolase of HD superfamily
VIDALVETMALKALRRAGWVRAGVTAPESVAAHSWGVAWLVLVLLPRELNRERALTYALLHDLPEVRTGDITPHDGVSPEAKALAEAQAMRDILAALPRAEELSALWTAYELQDDEEARFVRQLDRLDMAVQALCYADADRSEFLASAARVIDHPALVPVFDAIVVRHHALHGSPDARTRTS